MFEFFDTKNTHEKKKVISTRDISSLNKHSLIVLNENVQKSNK